MSIFSRYNVSFYNNEINDFIVKWLGIGRSSLPTFLRLLKSIDIKPAQFFNFNLEEKSFDCITDTDKILSLTLDGDIYRHVLQVIVKNKHTTYYYNYCSRLIHPYLELEYTEHETDDVKVADNHLRNLFNFATKYPFKQFCELLKSTNIVTPVCLCNFRMSDNSFDCITGDNKTLSITLQSNQGKGIRLSIYNGRFTSTYVEPINSTDSLFLSKVEGDRILSNFDLEGKCSVRKARFFANYFVDIFIDRGAEFHNIKFPVAEYDLSIENYLLNLSYPCTAQSIYKKLMKLYNFDDETISKFPHIKVTVSQIVFGNPFYIDELSEFHKLSSIQLRYGKICEYIETKKNATYGLSQYHDNYYYLTPSIHCSFWGDGDSSDSISVKITGNKNEISSINLSQVIEIASEKINSVRNKIN